MSDCVPAGGRGGQRLLIDQRVHGTRVSDGKSRGWARLGHTITTCYYRQWLSNQVSLLLIISSVITKVYLYNTVGRYTLVYGLVVIHYNARGILIAHAIQYK